MNAPLLLANLALTVLAMVLAIHAGLRRRRKQHYVFVTTTLVLLFGAIWQAELFGRKFDFEGIRLQVHLGFAFGALAALPGVAWSGARLAQAKSRRLVHRRWVSAFVLLVLFAVLTAGWMFMTATRK